MRRYASAAAAFLVVAVCYPLARSPQLSSSEVQALAARFRFTRVPLLEAPNHPPYKHVREVHPSLERISAWVSSLGAAATLTDLDEDGLANDLIWVDPRTDLVTVAPVPMSGDRYAPFALGASVWAGPSYDTRAIAPMGTLAGDFNGDGRGDFLIYFWGRTPLLSLRKGGPSSPRGRAPFADAFDIIELVEPGERWYSNAALQADLDGDGLLDLLIGNYFHDGARVLDANATGREVMHAGKAKALNGGDKHFFLAVRSETGVLRFREERDALPEEIARGWTLALAAADLDGDLLPEIYIANDFGPDRLLHNRSSPGRLQFGVLEGKRDLTTPKSCVLGNDSFKGMGVDLGDVNGDGLLDIYVSNIATKFGLTESHFLWLNTGTTAGMQNGQAPFVHGAEQLGLARSGFSFEARLADFDNDGVLEAIQACGFIKGQINRWPELQALGTSNDQIIQDPRFWPNFKPGTDLSGGDCNPFFVRARDGRYHDITPALGLAQPMVSRGIAIADVDGDGRLDYVAANQWGPSYLFKNEAPNPGAFLGLRLFQTNGTPAIGAVARVGFPDGRKLVGWVDGGSGHSGKRSPEIHFGLGAWDPRQALQVQVDWRSLNGRVRQTILELTPGWHAVRLGAEGGYGDPSDRRE